MILEQCWCSSNRQLKRQTSYSNDGHWRWAYLHQCGFPANYPFQDKPWALLRSFSSLDDILCPEHSKPKRVGKTHKNNSMLLSSSWKVCSWSAEHALWAVWIEGPWSKRGSTLQHSVREGKQQVLGGRALVSDEHDITGSARKRQVSEICWYDFRCIYQSFSYF